ncbi:MAG: tetratricopeptide repeat protein [Pontibacterium sp.]
MNKGRIKQLSLGASVMLLAGCATTQTTVPVETRTAPPKPVIVEKSFPVESKNTPAGSVVTPVDRQGVVVTPVGPARVEAIGSDDAKPISQAQQDKIATGGQWAKVAPQKNSRYYEPHPAAAPLLRSARVHVKSGQFQKAQATLDRAQRIAPNEPQVYLQMAQLRVRADKWQQAEQLALKGVQVGQGKPAILHDLWLLIADVRDQRGDRTGAQRATIKARRYE